MDIVYGLYVMFFIILSYAFQFVIAFFSIMKPLFTVIKGRKQEDSRSIRIMKLIGMKIGQD